MKMSLKRELQSTRIMIFKKHGEQNYLCNWLELLNFYINHSKSLSTAYFAKAIEEVNAVIEGSSETEAHCLNIDLFPLL